MTVPRPRAPWLIRPAKLPATTPPPLAGAWAPTDARIDAAELIAIPGGHPPEDVAVDGDGAVYCGTEDGRLWRYTGEFAEIADTGGRPLGIEVDPRDGTLIVCDAYRGLLRVTLDGAITDLTRAAAGSPIMMCNNAAITGDGVVYFSDSSSRFPVSHWRRDLLEHQPNGRVLAYDPASGETSVVANGLYFPNGVALTPDESALLVCETVAHRLSRIDLSSGEVTHLGDLPAYPDNMSAVGDGTFWIALASLRVPIAERLLPHPNVRRIAAVLPQRLQPQPLPHTIVARVDAAGAVLETLHGPTGHYPMLTGVRQAGDTLWLASLTEPALARVALD
ncbi:MAG TPA: SMP-30/gluconolactonase/LRE family protein [Dactylosporangium sp.]|nr:SMP-30/gluconolactonase/LRE family protein [Dactylosporangium sp.]